MEYTLLKRLNKSLAAFTKVRLHNTNFGKRYRWHGHDRQEAMI